MKITGSGNDFLIVDNRKGLVPRRRLPAFARAVLAPHLGAGGDGLILVEPASSASSASGGSGGPGGRQAHFRWRLFNPDGSEAEFSGNGSRCVARVAWLKRMAPRRMVFETLAGTVRAEVKGAVVKIESPAPRQWALHLKILINGRNHQGHFLSTGVPHCVYQVEDIGSVDVMGLGRAIRHHPRFSPAGTNVTFVQRRGPRSLAIRTYERGVEAETLACGSGSVASAVVMALLGQVSSPVRVRARSGEVLTVSFHRAGGTFLDIMLEGRTRIICEGTLHPESWTR